MTTDTVETPTDARDTLTCPVCEYALRGLPEPRCPECGYVFEWDELIERSRRRTSWFYEHAGTLRSHVVTRLRSLWPWSFWRAVHAYSDADLRRLRRYGGVTLLLTVGLTLVMSVALPVVGRWAEQKATALYNGRMAQQSPFWGMSSPRQFAPGGGFQWPGPVPAPGPWESLLTYVGELDDGRFTGLWVLGFMMFVWVVGLGMYWKLLGVTVLRASIRPVHLKRVNAYTSDALLFLFPAALWSLWAGDSFQHQWGAPVGVEVVVVPALVLVPLVVRLYVALARYVRFPQAAAVTAGYAIIVTLVWLIVGLNATV